MTGAERAADTAARQLACSEFTAPVVLEAGAGTGKTAAMIARVLTWCLGPGWERSARALPGADERALAGRTLERVVAITFTDKAASDMERKLREGLAASATGRKLAWFSPPELPAGDRERRAAALLASVERARFSTIHAFCKRLLDRHSLAAGLQPGFVVDHEQRLVAQLVEETLAARLPSDYGARHDEALVALAAAEIGPTRLIAAAVQLIEDGWQSEDLAESPFAPERWAERHEELTAAARSAAAATMALLGGGNSKAKVSFATARWLATLALALPAERDLARLCARLRADPTAEPALRRIADWRKGEFNRTETAAIGEQRAGLQEACAALLPRLRALLVLDVERFEYARQALQRLLGLARTRLRRAGVVCFEDLLVLAAKLLVERTDLCDEVRAGIDQLLVDEFQDTNPRQCELVRSLALTGPAGSRPGLFLVGDPKQSIYGWRNADLASYFDFVDEALRAGGAQRSLTVNFRSTPAILDEVQRSIAPIMHERRGVQPAFQQLLPCAANAQTPPFVAGARRAIEVWIAWDRATGAGGEQVGPRTPPAHSRQLEAAAIARDIRELIDQGVPAREIALLLRVKTSLDYYLEALREAGVDYVVEGARTWYRRREVIDLAAALRAILDPGDPLALLAFLRSPWIGIPDAAIAPLWSAGLPAFAARLGTSDTVPKAKLRDLIEKTRALLPGDQAGLELPWPETLARALQTLTELRVALSREPADRFLARMRATLLAEETAAARFLGAHRLANLQRFFARAAGALADPALGARGFARELWRGIEDTLEADDAMPGDETLDAVRVLTIHTSKGLEFEHVYLADLHWKPWRQQGNQLELARLDGRVEMRLFGMESLDFARVRERHEEVRDHEKVRLLYVAATRSKQRLVLAGGFPGEEGSHADSLRQREGWPDLVQRFAHGEHDVVDEQGVRWRFLEPPAGFDSARAPVVPPFELAAMRAGTQRLAALRAEAVARAARPLTAAVTALLEADASEEGREFESARPAARGDEVDAPAARAIGIALHRALASFAHDSDPAQAFAAARAEVTRWLTNAAPAAAPRVLARAEQLLGRLNGSAILQRLQTLAPHVLARELPFVAAPEDDRGPVGAVLGAIDLLYRDPADGRLVVADFKTDRIENEVELARRIAAHQEQGRSYARAVQRALRLDRPPRFELWFLDADRIVIAG